VWRRLEVGGVSFGRLSTSLLNYSYRDTLVHFGDFLGAARHVKAKSNFKSSDCILALGSFVDAAICSASMNHQQLFL
jgi:hypothetical protein